MHASSAEKLGVIEASYTSAVIGVERRLALDKPVARSRQGITATRAADSQSLRKASRPLRHDPCISKVVADEQVVVGHLAGRGGTESGTTGQRQKADSSETETGHARRKRDRSAIEVGDWSALAIRRQITGQCRYWQYGARNRHRSVRQKTGRKESGTRPRFRRDGLAESSPSLGNIGPVPLPRPLSHHIDPCHHADPLPDSAGGRTLLVKPGGSLDKTAAWSGGPPHTFRQYRTQSDPRSIRPMNVLSGCFSSFNPVPSGQESCSLAQRRAVVALRDLARYPVVSIEHGGWRYRLPTP